MNYLITGADGFVGANFIRYIMNEKIVLDGDEIFALMRTVKPDILSPLALSGAVQNVTPIICDILKPEKLKEYILKNGVNEIYHFAAQPIVKVAQKDPSKTFDINVIGTKTIMESARISDADVFIMSSDKVYGDSYPPYKEETNIGGSLRIYDASKSAAEIVARSYATTYGMKVRVARPCNIYGPFDLNFSRVIPNVIKEILTTGKYKVFVPDNLVSSREFLYVDDLAKAIHLIMSKGKETIYNIGSADGETSISELCDKISEVLDCGERVEVDTNREIKEIQNQYMDDSRIRLELEFDNDYDLADGLREAVDWYREYVQLRWIYE